MKKILALSLAMFLLLVGCDAKRLEDSSEIMKKVRDKYDKASSIQVDFANKALYQNSLVDFKGTYITKTPDKYYSRVNIHSDKENFDFTVTSMSNGKSIWKITERNKEAPSYTESPVTGELVTSKVNYMIFDEIDLQNQNYKLLRTAKEDNQFYYVMQLEDDSLKTLIWVNGDQWTVDKAEIYPKEADIGSQDPIYRCRYSNYIFNRSYDDDRFKYTPAKNAILQKKDQS